MKTKLIVDYDSDRKPQILFGRYEALPESIEEQETMLLDDIKMLAEALDHMLNVANKPELRTEVVDYLAPLISDEAISGDNDVESNGTW